ncbi:hypothetical protein ACWGLG_43925, partial [Streptomyces antimycoticus]
MTSESADTGTSNRRAFLRRASVAAAVPTAASLLGGSPGTAAAADSSGLPDGASSTVLHNRVRLGCANRWFAPPSGRGEAVTQWTR